MRDSVLIATPAYGGLLHSKYVMGLVGSCRELAARGIPHGLFILPNESLVSRARNRCAAYALQHGFGSLMFIDADLGWGIDDFMAIIGSQREVIGGTYPIKQVADPRLVYNPLHDIALPQGVRSRTWEELAFLREHHADPASGELQVKHVPTGFLKIGRKVLKKLRDVVPAYQQEALEGGWETHHDFFPVRPNDGIYESEDWAFCSLVRQHLDCGVWLNTRVVLSHTGSYTWTGRPDPSMSSADSPGQPGRFAANR